MNKVETATAFLSALFAPYAAFPAARVELRAWTPKYDPRPDPRPVRAWHPCDAAGIRSLARYAVAQSERRDVYVGVLPRVFGKGDAAALRLCGYLWCDVDGGDEGTVGAVALLQAATDAGRIPVPHIVVSSGSGLHAYWQLSAPAPCRTQEEQDKIRRTLRRIVLAVGGEVPGSHADRASAEPARVLRVPGTFNRKRSDEPRPVRLLRCVEDPPDARPLVWWCANLPAVPLPERPKIWQNDAYRRVRETEGFRVYTGLPPATVGKTVAGGRDGTKHFTMRAVAVSARKQGCEERAIRALVEQTARASGVNPDTAHEQQHINGIVSWAVARVMPG